MSHSAASAPDRSGTRAVTIALNASKILSRDAVCRLAYEPDRWLGQPIRDSLARELGVPAETLEQAQRAAENAPLIAAREERRARSLDASLVLRSDDTYPSGLRDLELPPPVLYLRGRYEARPAVSIVGSRRAQPWALELARGWARRFAERGLQVVSGFARGIDEEAHRGTLAANGSTVAVLGCGLDVDYPRGRERLRNELVPRGALLTELPFGAPPLRHHFPIRNRLIAALGDATLVVQAAARSGSLITARLALDLGRDVFAVPGRPSDRLSFGTNALLRDGAGLALDADELIEALPLRLQAELPEQTSVTAVSDPDGPLDRRILEQLRDCSDGATAEGLARILEARVEVVLSSLVGLELDGRVRRVAGSRFLARL
jgi:DNA processing protein